MGILVKHILKHSSGRRTFRRVVPEPLRPFCNGQWEYKVSLGLEGSPGFLSRYDDALRGYDELVDRARRQMDGAFDTLDAARIGMLADLFLAQSLADDESARTTTEELDLYVSIRADLEARGVSYTNLWQGDPRRRWAEKSRALSEETIRTCRDLRAVGDVYGITDMWVDEAELLAEAAGLVVDVGDFDQIQRLCLALNDAAIKAAELKLRRFDGDSVPTPGEPDLEVPARAPTTPQPSAPRTRLMTIYEGYADAQLLSPGVRSEWRRYIQRLIEFLGHDDARRITTEQLLDWRDHLLREPTRQGKPRDPTTVRDKYITSVRAALNWAVEERLLPTNPALNIKVRVPKKAKLRDRDFTPTEAKAILSANWRAMRCFSSSAAVLLNARMRMSLPE